MNPVEMDRERPVWNSAKALLLALSGGGLGYAGLIRLPAMAAEFGCGSALIAVAVAIAVVGWPLMTLELALGQRFRQSAPGALAEVAPVARALGCAMVGASLLLTAPAGVAVSWAVYPTLPDAVADALPSFANATSPDDVARHLQFDGGWNQAASFAALAGVWAVVAVVVLRGFWGLAWAVYVAVPVPAAIIAALCAFSFTRMSTEAGECLRPDTGSLLGVRLWANAVGQALLMTQAGTGVLHHYGSHCRPVHHIPHIALGHCAVALLSAVLVCLCFASTLALAGDTDARLGSTAAALPALLQHLPVDWVASVVAFAALLLLGLVSLAALVSQLFTVSRDALPLRLRFVPVSTLACIVAAVVTQPLKLRFAFDTVAALDEAVVSIVLPLLAGLECIVVGYFWQGSSLSERCATHDPCTAVVYHSVDRLLVGFADQDRALPLQAIFAFLVKAAIPVAGLGLAVAHTAVALSSDRLAVFDRCLTGVVVAGAVVGLGVGSVALCRRKPKHTSLWADADTIQAANAVADSNDSHDAV